MESILRKELKVWQKNFRSQHRREPTKRDILADPAIAGVYETWTAVGGELVKPRSSSAETKSASHAAKKQTSTGQSRTTSNAEASSSSSISESSSSSSKSRSEDPLARRHPPSPSKRNTQGLDVFKTPTKPKRATGFGSNPITPSSSGTGRHRQNPFHTPTRSNDSLSEATTSPTKKATKNPFATPTKAHRHPSSSATPTSSSSPHSTQIPPSPTGSVIDVEMTPVKVTPSPSKLLRSLTKSNSFDQHGQDQPLPFDSLTSSPTSDVSFRNLNRRLRDEDKYIPSSPSKVRSFVAQHVKHGSLTPRKAKSNNQNPNCDLMTYTPRTKARKRLRGEEVPPTPPKTNPTLPRRIHSDGFFVGSHGSQQDSTPSLPGIGIGKSRTEPRKLQRGLSTFAGFGGNNRSDGLSGAAAVHTARHGETNEKMGRRSVTAPTIPPFKASQVLDVEMHDDDDDEDEDEMSLSPSKSASRSFNRSSLPGGGQSTAERTGFKPLFVSPSTTRILPTLATSGVANSSQNALKRSNSDSGESSSSSSTSSRGNVGSKDGGGLFAAELEKRRYGHPSASSPLDDTSPESSLGAKKHKIRQQPVVPFSDESDIDDDEGVNLRKGQPASSPSSLVESTAAPTPMTLAAPSYPSEAAENGRSAKSASTTIDVMGGNTSKPSCVNDRMHSNNAIQNLVLSDDDDDEAMDFGRSARLTGRENANTVNRKPSNGTLDRKGKKVITVRAYQRYGILGQESREASGFGSDNDDEDGDALEDGTFLDPVQLIGQRRGRGSTPNKVDHGDDADEPSAGDTKDVVDADEEEEGESTERRLFSLLDLNRRSPTKREVVAKKQRELEREEVLKHVFEPNTARISHAKTNSTTSGGLKPKGRKTANTTASPLTNPNLNPDLDLQEAQLFQEQEGAEEAENKDEEEDEDWFQEPDEQEVGFLGNPAIEVWDIE